MQHWELGKRITEPGSHQDSSEMRQPQRPSRFSACIVGLSEGVRHRGARSFLAQASPKHTYVPVLEQSSRGGSLGRTPSERSRTLGFRALLRLAALFSRRRCDAKKFRTGIHSDRTQTKQSVRCEKESKSAALYTSDMEQDMGSRATPNKMGPESWEDASCSRHGVLSTIPKNNAHQLREETIPATFRI